MFNHFGIAGFGDNPNDGGQVRFIQVHAKQKGHLVYTVARYVFAH